MYVKLSITTTLYKVIILNRLLLAVISDVSTILTSYNLFDISLAFSLPFAIREPN